MKISFYEKVQNLVALFCNKPELFTEGYVVEVVRNVNKTDPQQREKNKWDERFIKVLPIVHKFDAALDEIDKFGYLAQTYFDHIADLEKNLELQRRFCEVRKLAVGNEYNLAYSGLLCKYLEKFELASEIKEEISSDDKYISVRKLISLLKK